MCADLANLGQSVEQLENAGVDYLHWDIMDGLFVPNFSMNQDFMVKLKPMTRLTYDTHLMIINPERYLDKFIDSGSDLLVIHAEATNHLYRAVQQILARGIKVGVAINPATPVCMLKHVLDQLDQVVIMTVNPGFAGQDMIPATLEKIREVRNLINKRGLETDIQVDGNVSFENIPLMKICGANVFVGGTSSIFREELSIRESVKKMRQIILNTEVSDKCG